MQRKARKFGQSLAITIPPYIAEKMDLKANDKIAIELKSKKIIITKEEN